MEKEKDVLLGNLTMHIEPGVESVAFTCAFQQETSAHSTGTGNSGEAEAWAESCR